VRLGDLPEEFRGGLGVVFLEGLVRLDHERGQHRGEETSLSIGGSLDREQAKRRCKPRTNTSSVSISS
jgi:hypothetical protein